MIFFVHIFDFCLGMFVLKKFSIYTTFRGTLPLNHPHLLCFNIYRIKNIAKCPHDIWLVKQVLELDSGVFSCRKALFFFVKVLCVKPRARFVESHLGNLGIISRQVLSHEIAK